MHDHLRHLADMAQHTARRISEARPLVAGYGTWLRWRWIEGKAWRRYFKRLTRWGKETNWGR